VDEIPAAVVEVGEQLLGGSIAAAYWFTASTSFANPAVTVGRVFSDRFAGLAAGSVPWFVVAQAIGACVGVVSSRTSTPRTARSSGA
jgi:glycerol uptake facilitator-like aquaporin